MSLKKELLHLRKSSERYFFFNSPAMSPWLWSWLCIPTCANHHMCRWTLRTLSPVHIHLPACSCPRHYWEGWCRDLQQQTWMPIKCYRKLRQLHRFREDSESSWRSDPSCWGRSKCNKAHICQHTTPTPRTSRHEVYYRKISTRRIATCSYIIWEWK